jgi:AcrR family transcriptional regulator
MAWARTIAIIGRLRTLPSGSNESVAPGNIVPVVLHSANAAGTGTVKADELLLRRVSYPSVGTTREAMIRAAERLFAERGINAVSLREVAAAAGQRNNSAVRYHFGSRDGLVDAVFEYRMARIDERRRAMLVALDAAGRGDDLRGLLEAVVYPLSESLGHDDGTSWYARFLRQIVFTPGVEVLSPSRRDVTRGLATVVARLKAHLAVLPAELRSQRVDLAFKLIVNALADHEAALASAQPTESTSLLVAGLVDAAAAIVEAPVSEVTARELTHTRRKGA